MPRSTRRDFLRSTGAAMAAGTIPPANSQLARGEPAADAPPAIPPHRSLVVEGVHAYTDKVSVAAGDSIAFQVSSTHPYDLQVCRLGLEVDNPESDQVVFSVPKQDPLAQPIHPGSYIHVERGLP